MIGVLYNDRSFFALITCLLPESVTDDLIWRICAIIQLLTSFDSDTHCFLLISVLFALLKEVENIIGESCEDLVWAYFTSKSKRKKTFWQDKVFALWRFFFMTIKLIFSFIPKSNKSLTIPFHAIIFKMTNTGIWCTLLSVLYHLNL